MHVKFRLMIAVCALAYVASFATGQDNPFSKLKGIQKIEDWKGQRIYPKWPAAKIKFWDETDKGRIDHKLSSDFPLQVVRDDGEKARVRDGDNEGWVAKTDYTLEYQREFYFTGRVDGNPQDAHAQKIRSLIAIEIYEFEVAHKHLDVFIKLEPKDPDGHMLRMEAWKGQVELDKAIESCSEWIRLMPGKYGPIAKRAELRTYNRDLDGALEDYAKAITLNPKNPNLYFSRGEVFGYCRAFDKQVADLDVALKLEPGNGTYLAARGAAKARSLDLRGGLDDLNEAVRAKPKDTMHRYCRACLLLLTRDMNASAEFERLGPNSDWYRHNAHEALIYSYFAARQAGDAKLAEKALKTATEKVGKDWPRPLIQYLTGEISEADVLEKAKKGGSPTEARCAIGVHLLLNGDRDSAAKHLQLVKDRVAEDSQFHFMIAVNLLDRIEKEKAAPKKK